VRYNDPMWRVTLFLLLAAGASAQLSFEVASIKPSTPLRPGESRGSSTTPTSIHWQTNLRHCIAFAYAVKDHQVSGPAWLADVRFELIAKAPEGAREADFPEMMRTLLAERFKLSAHTDTKEFSGFALVVGREGPKLKPAAASGRTGEYSSNSRMSLRRGGGGSVEYKRISMELLARNLTNLIGRTMSRSNTRATTRPAGRPSASLAHRRRTRSRPSRAYPYSLPSRSSDSGSSPGRSPAI
jgi:uncharacterized protein (TIGR03435 family)